MVTRASAGPKLEHKGYNRGLILGLTMAESMLLLVFCLLLVAAAMITAERRHRMDAEQRLAQLEQQNKELSAQLVEAQSKLGANMSAADRVKFESEWRELVSARQIIDRLKMNDASPADLAKLAAVGKVLVANNIPLDQARDRLEQLLHGQTEPHEWPPIINLSEAGGYYFTSGSAALTPEFEDRLETSIADQIADNLERYKVDVIEVIGHTDEQRLSRSMSNLDDASIEVIDGALPVETLQPADNAGLGLARAIAVANILKANPKLKDVTVLPMSAAQLVIPGDTLTSGRAGNVKERRRIEIRIRRRAESLQP
ncbi:OmpA family protein [Rhizobium sp. BK379]|jgi:flagellar motor protein MotB|uniref:OmpA family protein n=1 Tax=Rhizobium sp. BK379 TaxID=2587059 RepID=UPI001612ED5A|nr:OmpA family protein [Rhizobium sp. BK379]MBB3447116.1 flagellar motor protein MotB [Rhizobium sp. BK379]